MSYDWDGSARQVRIIALVAIAAGIALPVMGSGTLLVLLPPL